MDQLMGRVKVYAVLFQLILALLGLTEKLTFADTEGKRFLPKGNELYSYIERQYQINPTNIEVPARLNLIPDAKVYVDLCTREPDYRTSLEILEEAIATAALKHPAADQVINKVNSRLYGLLRAGLKSEIDNEADLEKAIQRKMAELYSCKDVGAQGCMAVLPDPKDSNAMEATGKLLGDVMNPSSPLYRSDDLRTKPNLREKMFFVFMNATGGYFDQLLRTDPPRPRPGQEPLTDAQKEEYRQRKAAENAARIPKINESLKEMHLDFQLTSDAISPNPFHEGIFATAQARYRFDNKLKVSASEEEKRKFEERKTFLNRDIDRRMPLSTRELQFLQQKNGLKNNVPQFTPGALVWKGDLDSLSGLQPLDPYVQGLQSTGMRSVASISGTTDRLLTLGRYLGLNDREMEAYRLAILGYLVDGKNHSTHEVLWSSQSFPPLDYKMGPEYYKSILKGDTIFSGRVEAIFSQEAKVYAERLRDSNPKISINQINNIKNLRMPAEVLKACLLRYHQESSPHFIRENKCFIPDQNLLLDLKKIKELNLYQLKKVTPLIR
jgi:hypothetical protein